jgi:hypothetical protein
MGAPKLAEPNACIDMEEGPAFFGRDFLFPLDFCFLSRSECLIDKVWERFDSKIFIEVSWF